MKPSILTAGSIDVFWEAELYRQKGELLLKLRNVGIDE